MPPIRNSGRRNGKSTTRNVGKLDLPPGYRALPFVRHRDNGGIALIAADNGSGWSFSLNQIPDFGEFTTLFDAYTIDKVTMKFVLFNNTPEEYPVLLLAPDYDDSGLPLGESDLLTMEQARVLPFSPDCREHTITIKPRVAQTLFRTGITSSYGWGKESQIVDMATTDTPHYGARHWLVNYNSVDTPGAVVRVFIKYHIRCIGQR